MRSEVYNQSICIMNEVVYLLVAPVDSTRLVDLDAIKKRVALEGARYIQRIITDDDIIGLTWGGTMYHLIQYLNPCRRKGAKIITLHGSIADCDEKLAVDTLVKRAAMAFGGKNISLCRSGLLKTKDAMDHLKESDHYQKIQTLFSRINIAISGVGALYPDITTLLATTNYLNEKELEELKNQGAYCDLLLRFIDCNGRECETSMKDRTYSISLETYRAIPLKVIVASGSEKANSVRALLNGKLLDVLIIDQLLARALMGTVEHWTPGAH